MEYKYMTRKNVRPLKLTNPKYGSELKILIRNVLEVAISNLCFRAELFQD